MGPTERHERIRRKSRDEKLGKFQKGDMARGGEEGHLKVNGYGKEKEKPCGAAGDSVKGSGASGREGRRAGGKGGQRGQEAQGPKTRGTEGRSDGIVNSGS